MEYKFEFEEWRDIPEYFGLYQVSNLGRVRSLGNGNSNNSKERLLKQCKDKDGYLKVYLCKDGKQKNFLVHRLVAIAFLPNPDNLPIINHKNEDKTDNRVENLEWCTAKYNTNYGTCRKRMSKARTNGKRSKPVAQYTLDGTLIGIYPSASEAARQGFNQGNVDYCCRGKYKTSGGYIWKWAD